MDEIADSEINVEELSDSISADLFGVKEEVSDETDEIEETEETEEPTEEKEEVTEETVAVKPPPQSWKKEMHEKWSSLDPDIQEYVELREQQMKEGIDVAKEDATLGRDLRDVLNPFNQLLESQGVDQKTAVQYLMNAHYKLSTADEQGKLDALNQIAQSYGIKLDGSKVTPEIQTLQQEIGQLKQILNQTQAQSRQAEMKKISEELDAFASTHDYFDEVTDEMAPFLERGFSLQDAYDKAIWANPVTRQKEQSRLEKEKLDKLEAEKKEKLEKAKKAKSPNVKTKDTVKAPTGPTGKMFDDLHELAREIQSR